MEPEVVQPILVDLDSNTRFQGAENVTVRDINVEDYSNIQNLYPDQDINAQRANNQTGFEAIRNGFSQLITGTVGELVKTPGYLGSMFEDVEEMDKGVTGLFLEAGDVISKAGEEFAPIYQSESSQEKVFAPWDSEWMANTIAQFGPTVALVGMSLATEGLATPAMLRMLSVVPEVGKYAEAALLLKNESKLYNTLRTINSTALSRHAESNMEAYQTFQETYAKLQKENPEMSDEEMRKLAGEAGSKVYKENWALVGLDLIQYHGLLHGFGKFGKVPGFLLGEAAPESIEEGLQYTFQKEAKEDLDFKLGKIDTDKSVIETFISSLGDTEMQQAMVQGGIGASVFMGAGKLVDKLMSKYQQPIKNSITDVIQEASTKGDLSNLEKDIEVELSKPETTPEHKAYLNQVQQAIQKFKEVEDTIDSPYKSEVAKLYTEADLHSQEIEKIDVALNKIKGDKSYTNASYAVDYVEATQAPTQIDKLKTKYSKNPLALSILDKMEKEYEGVASEITTTVPSISTDAAKVVPLVKPHIKSKVEQKFLTEYKLQLGSEVANGKLDNFQDVIEGIEKQQIKRETNIEKLLELRNSDNQELSKASKSRLKELYDKEDKTIPTNLEELVPFYEKNPLTFKKFVKDYDLPEGLTIDQFKEVVNTPEFQEKFEAKKESRKQDIKVQEEEAKIAEEVEDVKVESTPIISTDESNQPSQVEADNTTIEQEPNYIDITQQEEQSDEVDSKEGNWTDVTPNRIRTTDAYMYYYDDGIFYVPSMKGGRYNESEFNDKFQRGNTSKGWHVLYDKEGQVVFMNNEPTLDVDFLRNLGQVGDVYEKPVTLEVDKNYISGDKSWSNSKPLGDKENGWKSLKVAVKIDGKTIGFLPDYDSVKIDPNNLQDLSYLEQIRKTLFNNTKNTQGIYTYPTTTTIKSINPPRFWLGPRTHDLISLQQSAQGSKLPIILGLVKNGKLFLNNAPLTDKQKEDLEGKFNLSDGAVYWLLTNPVDGNYVPYRLFTTKVKDNPKVQKQIKDLLESITEQNWKTKRNELQELVRWKNDKGKYEPDFGYTKNGKFFVVKDGEKIYDITPQGVYDFYVNERGYNIIEDSPLQVESDQLNQEGYNEALIKQGYFSANLNAGLFHSPNFRIDLSKLVENNTIVEKRITRNKAKFSTKDNRKITKWNEQEETKWFKEKVGNLIDLNIVDESEMNSLVESLKYIHGKDNVEAWGFFHRASVYLLQNNRKNIAYHEAYHVVETLALTESQIEALNKVNTEEDRAELFETYVEMAQVNEAKLKQTPFYKQLGASIKRLFRKMYLAVKASVGLNLSQDEVFFRIQSGTYKDNKGFKKNVDTFKPSIKAYADNLKQQDRLNQVQREFNELYLEARNKGQKEGLSEQQILDKAIKPTLDGNLNRDNIYYQLSRIFLNEAKQSKLDGDIYASTEYIELSKKLFDDIEGSIKDKFGPLFWNALDNLKNYGIRVNRLQGDLDINDETQDLLENWMEVHPPSSYEAMSKQIKMGLAALPRGEFVGEEFEAEFDDLGYARFVDPFEVYSFLKDELSDSLSVEDFMENLNKLGEDIGWAKVLHQILSGSRPSTIIVDTELFKSQLYQFLQEPEPTFKYLLQTIKNKKEGQYEWRFNNSASKSIATRLSQEWLSNINSPLYNKILAKDKVEELQKELNDYIDSNNDDVSWLYKALNDLGITMSREAIEAVVAKKKGNKRDFLKNFKGVVDNVGKENFDELMVVKNSLGEMAKLVKKYYPEFHLPAFTNVEGETVQNYIRNSFMARQMNKFKSSKYRRGLIDFYRTDKFYAPNDRKRVDAKTEIEVRDDSYSLWLDRIQNNDAHNKMDFAVLDGQKLAGETTGTPYADLSPLEFNRMILNAFYNNGNYKAEDNRAGKSYYSAQIMADSSSHALIGFESYTQEQIINKLEMLAQNEYFAYLYNQVEANKTGIKGYNPKLMFIPGLIENRNNLSPQELQEKAIQLVQNTERLREAIKTNLDRIVEQTIKDFNQEGLIEDGKSVHLDYRIKDINEFIKDFVYNDFFAQTQIISLFHGKLYQYKSMEDFYKRAKEIWSPGTFIDTSRTGVNEKFMTYFVDSKSTELNYRNNKESVDAIYNNIIKAGFSEDDAKKAAAGYGYTDGTNDGKAVTLSDGKVIESGSVDATDAQGIIDIYRWREIMLGKGMEKNEVERIFEAIINDTYTLDNLSMVMNPIKQFYYTLINVNGQISGLQIKNSEYVLIPQVAKGNKQLEDILDFLKQSREKYLINASINYDSAVKVGLHNVNTSTNQLDLNKAIELDNREYRIQGEVPEHQVDTTNLLGTQLRKLIVGDLNWDDVYEVANESMSGKELIEEWNQLLIGDVEYSSNKLKKEFGDPTKFYKMLQDEARSRDYPDKFIEALTLVDGKPRLGLFHPLLTKKSQALISSVFRNNITKMKFNGMSTPNVSSFGSDELKIVYNADGSIKHFEAYLPLWSESLVRNLKNVDVASLEELGLDLGVSYRIPTEGKYSMIPIKIKGFVNAGIVLPSEITKVAGLDFDIDKMYVMLYEYITYNDKNGNTIIKKPEYHTKPTFEAYKRYVDENSNKEQRDGAKLRSTTKEEYYNELAKQQGLEDFATFQSEFKASKHNTQKARDNRKLDIIRSVLNNPKTIKAQLTPGGFDDLKAEANRIEKVKGSTLGNINPMTLISRTKIFARMMAGKKLIGIPANYNATHALMQHNNLELVKPIVFNGFEGKDLGLLEVMDGSKLVSNNVAQYLASVVDNGKDPLADKYNLNTYTADVAMLLAKFFPIETGMKFIAQPSVVEFYKEYVNAGANFKAEEKAIKKVLGMSKKDYFKAMEEFQVRNITDEMLEDGLKDNPSSGAQKDMLLHFLYYKNNQSKDLGKLVAAIKVPDAGASSSIAKTVNNVAKVNDASALESITGIKEFLNNENLANNSLYEKGILDAMKEFVNLGFPDYIKETSAFVKIQNRLSELKGSILSEKEINLVNDASYTFLSSGFLPLKNINTLDVIQKTPKLWADFIELNRKEYHALMGSIDMVPSEHDDKQLKLVLNNNQPKDIENKVMNQWEDLMKSDKPINSNYTEGDLGRMLTQYAFVTNGFRFTTGSLSHIQPISFYENLTDGTMDYNTFIEKQIDSANNDETYLSQFYDQFIRHYFPRLSYVKSIEKEDGGIRFDEETKEPYSIIINDVQAKKYVKYRDADTRKWYLFKMDFMDTDSGTAHYSRINPLGLYREVEEWNFDITPSQSIFDQNNMSKDLEKLFDTYVDVNDVDEPTANVDIDRSIENTNQEGDDTVSPCIK